MKQKITKHKYIVLAVTAAIIVGGAVWLWPFGGKNSTPGSASPQTASPGSNSNINYGPATQTEKQDSQNAKSQDLQNNNSSTPAAQNGKKVVQVQILSASTTSVKANVIGVFEDGGTCTATVTKGSESHAFTSKGIASSNYTQCEPINVTGITGSGWSVIVIYSSATSSGQSQAAAIN